jgi:hypothetical protein
MKPLADFADLMTPGEFSEPDEIRRALEKIRLQAGAKFVVLLALEMPNRWSRSWTESTMQPGPEFVSRKLFGSLLFVAHSDREAARSLQEELTRFVSSDGGKTLESFNRLHVSREPLVWNSEDVERLLSRKQFVSLNKVRGDGREIIAIVSSPVPYDSMHPMEVALVFGIPDGRTPDLESLRPELSALSQLVIRSEAVVLNRSMTLSETIENVLFDCKTYVDQLSLDLSTDDVSPELRELIEQERLSLTVLTAAVSLTESLQGDIFLTSKDPETLFHVASCGVAAETLTTSTARYLSSVDLRCPLAPISASTARPSLANSRSKSVVPFVHEEGRIIVMNKISDFTEMQRAVFYTNTLDTSDETAAIPDPKELAVPLAWEGGARRDNPAIYGVLNLEKSRGRYTASDVFIARHLAQYFCLQRTSELDKAADALIEVARAIEIDTSDIRSFCQLVPSQQTMPEMFPVDYLVVRKQLEILLEALFVATRSTHVTIRIASTDGQRLFRFAEWPQGKGRVEYEEIAMRQRGSVNAWVFRKGKSCYVPNIDHPGALLEFDGLEGVIRTESNFTQQYQAESGRTRPQHQPGQRKEFCRSEYCLPLLVKDRIVGTVDLESMFISAYEGRKRLVRRVAKELSLTLTKAQAAFEQQLFMILATARLGSHEILGVADELDKIAAGEEGGSFPDFCKMQSATLKEIVSQVSSISFSRLAAQQRSLRELIVASVGKWAAFHEVILDDPGNLLAVQFADDRAFRLSLIFRAILSNAMSACDMTPRASVKIVPRVVRRGGETYLAVTVSNPIQKDQIPGPEKRLALFRGPIATDRWHLGTFMAGVLARSLGGDVYADFVWKEKPLQTELDIEADDDFRGAVKSFGYARVIVSIPSAIQAGPDVAR